MLRQTLRWRSSLVTMSSKGQAMTATMAKKFIGALAPADDDSNPGPDQSDLRAILDRCRPKAVFEFEGEGRGLISELFAGTGARDNYLGAVSEGDSAGVRPGWRLVTCAAGDAAFFNFLPFYQTMDFVLLPATADQDDLLRNSMHAFKMIKPEGVIVWHRSNAIDKALRKAFEQIGARFPLRHMDAAGLTIYGLPEMTPPGSAATERIELTVIVATSNGADRLPGALDSVLNQSLPASLYEIIVVDNNSTDRTPAVVSKYIQRVGDRVRYVLEPAPGLGNARHAGARAARGAILCYLDDDAVAAPTWLSSIRDAFRKSDVGLVGGRILPRYEIDPPAWLERLWYATASGKSLGQLSLLDFGDQAREIDPDFVWGCNYAVRKTALIEAGGFHPDALPAEFIRYRGDGEIGLSRKIRQQGYRAWYHPDAAVHHIISADRLTPRYFFRRQFNQGISDSYAHIRKEGPPNRCEVSRDLLDELRRFMAALADSDPAPGVAADPVVFDRQMQRCHEFGRLYHIHQTLCDPGLLAHVCRKDYMTPALLSPDSGVDTAHRFELDQPGVSAWHRAVENYRAGLWLAENGFHNLAVDLLSRAERGGVKPAGTDVIYAMSLVETGQLDAAEAVLVRILRPGPINGQVDALRERIRKANVAARTVRLTEARQAGAVDTAQLPLTLTSAAIYITERCNSRCITCNAWKNTTAQELDTAAWKQALSRIRTAGISAVEFVGGEPLLRPDLTELIAEAKCLGYSSILVSTNGFLLDAARTAEIITAGANSFHISLDGFEETYLRLRGRDWFGRIRQTLTRLADADADLLVLTTLTRQNVAELERIVAFVHDIGGRWYPNILENGKYLFKGIDTDTLAIKESEEIARLAEKLSSLKSRFPRTVSIDRPEINYIKQYLESPENERCIPCTLGFDAIYLDPRGNLYSACMSIPPVGNLTETDLSKLLGSEGMRRRLQSMVSRRCPGCTCGYSQRAQYMHRMRQWQ